ncbi:MAG: hypothetical protein PHR06_04285 [Candidatus Cloacimonetes bacterium]|nr:hypothetical protein [Candidatus Cloacimonadota bacterium]
MKRLYELMEEIKEMSPWNWMDEDDIFFIENPENGDISFISVMGAIGQHYSVAIYNGIDSFYKLTDLKMLQDDPFIYELFFEIDHFQASFESKEALRAEDIKQLKKLKLKFKSQTKYPLFRHHKPGLVPWFIDKSQETFIKYALEQLLVVAPLIKEDISLLFPDCSQKRYLMRKMINQNGITTWISDVYELEDYSPPEIQHVKNPMALEILQKIKPIRVSIEFDFFIITTPIMEKRPVFPYAMIIVDPKSGQIINFQMITVKTNLNAMHETVYYCLLGLLANSKLRTSTIKVKSAFVKKLIEPIVSDLNVNIKIDRTLKSATEAKIALINKMEST